MCVICAIQILCVPCLVSHVPCTLYQPVPPSPPPQPQDELLLAAAAAKIEFHAHAFLDQINEIRMHLLLNASAEGAGEEPAAG